MTFDDRRIVVTGMGVVSPLGSDLNTYHASLQAGKSGIVEIHSRHDLGYRTNRAGRVSDSELSPWTDETSTEFSRSGRFAYLASRMALTSAAWSNFDTCGLVLGTVMGEMLEWESVWEGSHGNQQSASVSSLPSRALSEKVASALELRGPSHLIASTCASGNHAIDWACDELRAGNATAMLAVGVDTLPYIDLLGFNRLFLQDPVALRPFDRNRKGTILAEGSGALLLESAASAIRRGAQPLAEVAGCGLSCDADPDFYSRSDMVDALLSAAHSAFREAGLMPACTDYVSAHGSGTKLNDVRETNFLKAFFGGRAAEIPTSSIKSMLGHAQAAASSFEAIAAVLSIQHDVLYPTINYQTPDPECDLDCLPNAALPRRVDVIMSNAFGIGGNNSVVVFKRWSG